MISHHDSLAILTPAGELSAEGVQALGSVGFEDLPGALKRFQELCLTPAQREIGIVLIPRLLYSLSEAASPDTSLINFLRVLDAANDRELLFTQLKAHPRSIEILIKLFVGSQFLSEILISNPEFLQRFTTQNWHSEVRSRAEFVERGLQNLEPDASLREVMLHLRRFQQWELIRLAGCDLFGLMDLRTVTLQIALLADSIVQIALSEICRIESLKAEDFTVIALGKLGGEELNYSSDIDLIFVCEEQADRYWGLGQALIKALAEPTELGFLYRVDMRLRPWGSAGPLVTTCEAWSDYLKKSGQLWEKQSLLKARPIAGNLKLGERAIARIMPFVFDVNVAAVRNSIRETKAKIEQQLARKGITWGEVKTGPGGIRDIEFVTQFLQWIHGANQPQCRSLNTYDGLIRLAEMNLIFPEEFRRLTEGYLVLRNIEHALQLMHNQQDHRLPRGDRQLLYLARRLDFIDVQTFLHHYEQHCRSVREIFERYLHFDKHPLLTDNPGQDEAVILNPSAGPYRERFQEADVRCHRQLLRTLSDETPIRIHVQKIGESHEQLTIAGIDQPGVLATICGLMFLHGIDTVSGDVFTASDVDHLMNGVESVRYSSPVSSLNMNSKCFINVFEVRQAPVVSKFNTEAGVEVSQTGSQVLTDAGWAEFERDLNQTLTLPRESRIREVQAEIAHRVTEILENHLGRVPRLMPMDLEIDNETSSQATILQIRSQDTPGFLYELTSAIALNNLAISRMTIRRHQNDVFDTLHVVDEYGLRIESETRLTELRTSIVLIKHFTHLLRQSSNPGSALLHFQQFLENLFRQPNWVQQFSPLQSSEVLQAIASLLGVSDFLWEDFLRIQHENLFPVIANVEGLQKVKLREELVQELDSLLKGQEFAEQVVRLNSFKDREMLRIDMRHILGLQEKFSMFGQELTELAEVVVLAAWEICGRELQEIYGVPRDNHGEEIRYALCGLGKFGGRELGFASDIELLILYAGEGDTDGAKSLASSDYFERLVNDFRAVIHTRRKGIFEIDLRLRPYGKAGQLAVSAAAFTQYFSPGGPAWPYERQALVKLRPFAGEPEFLAEIVKLRDRMIFRGEIFDVASMRAMRERQIRQLLKPAAFNAKLSPGGVVDCEYLIQAMQITYGHVSASLREPNTREAMKALERFGLIPADLRVRLRDAYRFFRRVIDALRVVRGDTSDLTIPEYGSPEFLFLSRRLKYFGASEVLRDDLERHAYEVQQMIAQLPTILRQPDPQISDD